MPRRRRKLLWAPFGTGTQALAASAAVSVDLMALIRIAVPSVNNFTVVRIRGWSFVRVAALVRSDPTFYEAAITVVTQPAFDAGASPDPENDDASYMWRQTMIWSPHLVAEQSAGQFKIGAQLYEVDVKAKRRVDQADNTVVFVIKNRQAIASDFGIEGMMLLDLR